MLQENIQLAFSFLLLVFLQFLVFSNINLFGFVNPFIYLLFLVRYRLDGDQTIFLLLSFALGFCIDLILNTAGAHTIATLTVAFLRPLIVSFSFGINADIPYAMLKGTRLGNQLTYLGLLVLTHTIIYYAVQYFSWLAFFQILKIALLTTIFTCLLIWLILGFYKTK